jgi:hypothetical protein
MSSDEDREYTGNGQPESVDDVESPEHTQRLPAVDLETTSTEPAAPPVDIDERDATTHHADPPDVIELPDHTEPGESTDPGMAGDDDYPEYEPGEGTEESPDAPMDDLQDAWESDTYVDPEMEDTARSGDMAPADENAAARSAGVSLDGATGNISTDTGDSPATDGALGEPSAPTRTVIFKAKAESHSAGSEPFVHETITGERGGDGADDGEGIQGPNVQGRFGRLLEPIQQFFHPTLHLKWTTAHRLVLLGGSLLILLALLASNAGAALIIASAIVPVLIVLTLSQHDVFERESALLITATGVIGGLIGIVIGTLGSWLTSSNWFDSGKLNYGAAGFGGRFADIAGTAPFSVWFLNGLILPLIALAGIAAAPIALRRMPQFRNEVMDGVVLVGASAAGFAIGTALVYWSPMLGDRGPQTSVGDWTLTTIGMVLLRPVGITLAGAMLGAGIWRYMISPKLTTIVFPAVGSIGAFLLLTFGSIQLQPAGLWPELIWTLVVVAAACVIYRIVLRSAIASDRSVLGTDQGRKDRVVCPNCREVTPAGAFCANCGQSLPDPAVTTGDVDTETSAATP